MPCEGQNRSALDLKQIPPPSAGGSGEETGQPLQGMDHNGNQPRVSRLHLDLVHIRFHREVRSSF
jgi:hypothetical protein